jgi:hypothetical protein
MSSEGPTLSKRERKGERESGNEGKTKMKMEDIKER